MKKIFFVILISALLLVTGCARSVDEITSSDSFVDEKVVVKGTAKNVLKVGGLSGFTLVDENGDAIVVSSNTLPAEGEQVKVKGVLEKGPLGVFLINAN